MPKNVKIQGEILTIKIPERVIAKDLGWLGEQEIEQKVTVFMIRNFSNLRYFEDVRECHKKRLPNDLDNAELVGLEVKVPYLDEYRTFLIINKAKKSPRIYPRNFKKIKKQPL